MPVIVLESTIVAAQDQAISSNYIKNEILKEETDSKCWLCKQHEGTIDHLTSGCSILVKDEYLMRHDSVCAHLHYSIHTALGTETTDICTPICLSQCINRKILQCCEIKLYTQTETEKFQQIGKIKGGGTCMLMYVAIPTDRNVVQKEVEKKLKYKSLCIEIQQMWYLKCKIVPVIIGATRVVTKGLRQNLEAVPGKHLIDSLQKTAILGTSHIIQKVLQCEA
jgi:hypothetical protein